MLKWQSRKMEVPGSLSHQMEDNWLSSWRLASITSNFVCARSKQLYEKTLEIIPCFVLFLLLHNLACLGQYSDSFPAFSQVKVQITQLSIQTSLELIHI